MELEEMKSKWMEMSAEIEKQKVLTDALIIRMTSSDFRRKINKIRIPEIIGSVICVAQLLYMALHFDALNNSYLMICGIVSALILTVLPILSFRAISGMSTQKIGKTDYREILYAYSKAKLNFILVQKISFVLGFVLMITLLPVAVRLMGAKEVLFQPKWVIFYAIGFPLFYFFASRVFRSYTKSANDAGLILKELEAE